MTPREEAIAAAGAALAYGHARMMSLPPRQAAEEAWSPTGPSVDELEVRIAALQARQGPTDTSEPTG